MYSFYHLYYKILMVTFEMENLSNMRSLPAARRRSARCEIARQRDATSAESPLPTDPQTARKVLLDCYKRAFLAERDCDRAKAQFWIEVYGLVGERVGRR
jgi:hypothetical protein